MRKTKTKTKEEQELLLKIGEQIKSYRTDIGLSQEKLAFKTSLDRTYIGSVERGERNIAVINLQKIATALNISISELLKFN